MMVAVAGVHASRLLRRPPRSGCGTVDVDLTHTAMGVAMALMLLIALPVSIWDGLAVLFALSTLWFVGRATRAHVLRLPGGAVEDGCQVAIGVAMVYMLTIDVSAGMSAGTPVDLHGAAGQTMPGMGGAPGPGGLGSTPYSGLALLLVLLMVLVSGWFLIRLAGRLRPGRTDPTGRETTGATGVLSPTVALACHLAMSSTTVYLLVAAL